MVIFCFPATWPRKTTIPPSKSPTALAGKLREVLAIYQEAEDLITIGAYAKGSSPKIDYAIGLIDAVNAYLRQQIDEQVSFEESIQQLHELFAHG